MNHELTPQQQAERREIAKRAAVHLQHYLDEITAAADQVEEATGVPIVHRRPHILDARRNELDHLRVQAQAWLLAMSIVDRWMVPDDRRALGDICKVMPSGELTELRRALRLAGALDDGGDLR